MMPRYVSNCVKRPLQVTVILMVALSTSHTKQCKLTTPERDDSVIIKNVGIKMCQLKCVESGQCLSIQFNIDTLNCRLSRAESRKTNTKEGYGSLARNHSDVSAGSCKCSFGQRCFKTRSGKSVCLQDEKNFPEKSPQHKVVKEDTLENSPLHDACRKGSLTRVRRILSQGLVDINSRDGNHGKTPLMVAAQEGHCRIFNFLIRKGANKSHVDSDGKNFLHWACRGGHVGIIECLFPQYNININNKYVPLLMQAAFRGYRDVCEFLLCMGANVSQSDGDNVLHWVCRGGHLDVVKYLLSQCSLDINSRGKAGQTPLMDAVSWGRTDVGQLLISMGANLSQIDKDGNNVLHWGCRNGRLGLMKSVLSQGSVDINCRGLHGKTPLMDAAFYGKRKVFDLLVSQGGQTHLVDDEGKSILHLAVVGGHEKMVKHILSQNMTDVNSRDQDGKTAAMIAKHTGNNHMYKLLVSSGCPVI